MRILVCSYYFRPSLGGYQIMAERVALGLDALGHEVRVLTATPDGPDPGGPLPVPVVRNPGPLGAVALFRWADLVVFKHPSLRLGWPLLAIRRPALIWYAAPLHADEGPLARAVRWRLMRSAVNVANSRATARTLPRADAIVHPGYASATFRDLVPWEDRRGDFVFVGRLGPGKGVPVLLRALAMVPAARLTLVGDGPDREALVRQAGELDLSARVQFAGRQPQDECNNLLNAHRVAVFPSTYPEGFGTVALEALAAGARVIVSDAGGLPDAAGPTGHVVPAGDAEALAAKMAEVLAMDPPAPDELARADAHLAANTFDASFRDLVAMLPLSGPAARRIRTV